MGFHIVILSENTAGNSDLLAEWGLSILVKGDDANILFDTGQNISTSYNADALGIDLCQVNKIVLSHGHFDHTGGLRQVLRKMSKKVEIIAHPDIWASKFSRRQGQADKYVGIPFQRQEIESLGAKFNLTAKPLRITSNMMTTGEIPMVTDFEKVEPNLWTKEDAEWQADKLLDDQGLIINTEQGLVVILGCAHRGIINTLYYAQQLTGVKAIHMVLGGAHLHKASEGQLLRTIAALRELGVQQLSFCHCTGLKAASLIAQEFGDKFIFSNAGTSIEIA